MRWLCLFVFSLLLNPVSYSLQDSIPDLIEKVESSVVVIFVSDKDGNQISQGSGFFVNAKGEILTNYHVLQDAESANVKLNNGKVFPITMIMGEDKEGDLIQVKADIPKDMIVPLSLSSIIPRIGEQVVVIGSPLGLEKTVSEGIVSAIRELPTGGNFIQITASISPSSSGSPVMNGKGEVIGIATSQYTTGQNLNFAVSAGQIKKLKTNKGKSFKEWKSKNALDDFASATDFSNGVKYYLSGDYEKALSFFLQAIQINPDDAAAHYNLGNTYNDLGQHQEAIKAFKQAIQINPDDAVAHNNLGNTYNELGQHQEAIKAFKQAL